MVLAARTVNTTPVMRVATESVNANARRPRKMRRCDMELPPYRVWTEACSAVQVDLARSTVSVYAMRRLEVNTRMVREEGSGIRDEGKLVMPERFA